MCQDIGALEVIKLSSKLFRDVDKKYFFKASATTKLPASLAINSRRHEYSTISKNIINNQRRVEGDSIIYRINAGGPEVTTSVGMFAADDYFSPKPGNSFSTTSPIAATTDDIIYQTERYGTNGLLSYALHVANGSYTVRLHFAELYWTTTGKRLFDITIEGQKVKDNFDMVATAGPLTAITESFPVKVTDGVLNIDFSSLVSDGGVDEPKVSAIEVQSNTAGNQAPVAAAGIDTSITLPVSVVTLNGTGSSDADGSITSYAWNKVSGPGVGLILSPNSAITSITGLTLPGLYVFSLTVLDNNSPVKASATDFISVTVNAAQVDSIIRINCGGPQLVTSMGKFSADDYFSPTPGFTYSVSSMIKGTTDQALYETERSCPDDNGSFSYAIPVNNGSYIVKLHFAELFWTLKGQRKFDVTIEGKLELDNYDIVAKVGSFTATNEPFMVNVRDGLLNIVFDASFFAGGVNRPKVSAIEIIPLEGENQVPVANAGADQRIFLPNTSVTLNGSESVDPGGSITRYRWTTLTGPSPATIMSADSATTKVTGLSVSGNYLFRLTVMDDNSPIKALSTDDVIIIVSKASASKIIRINAGGTEINTTMGPFFADANFTPAPGFTYSTASDISGTTNKLLYQTERSATTNNGFFSYNIAIPNGNYYVTLHFAEIYWNGPAKRKFDVTIEGELKLDNYDIFARAGAFTAITEIFPITVTDGVLDILFDAAAPIGGVDRPKICGIEIVNAELIQSLLLDINLVRGPLQVLTVKAMGNPGYHQISLEIKSSSNAPVVLRVFNSSGQLIEVKNDVGINRIVRFGTNYGPGLYIAEVWQGNVKVKTKIIRL
ncbi:MAG: malectin domain-containing carbohydrate-binding protein [Chitinophagaceae bacterium]